MRCALFADPVFETHNAGLPHPERPERLAAIAAGLEDPSFADLDRRTPPAAGPDLLALVHTPDHIAQISAARPDEGFVSLDGDTAMSPGSWDAAVRAVGAAVAA
ncbi:MAG: histone deacetylase family protein, partial [Pseudomonadota bacterium]